ncbi:MAG: hypothetical protein ABNH27_14500 [Alcanivorax sp.]|uniref:DUF7151 family protein n=1 Tax=Alcanivorax sp. TaxID=1872427 RepID=UPI0032D8FC40
MAAASLRLALALVVTAFLSGCGGEDGKDGINGINGSNGRDATPVLINSSAEPAGPNCPAGGSRIDSGQDVNLNGTLDSAEIQVASYVCHGSDGVDGLLALASTEPVEPGEECSAGGYRIDTGIDLNGNGVLETAEIQHTSYACNGLDGADGEDGQDGEDGEDGQDGLDGLSALIKTEIELPGAVCPAGGVRVLSGVDTNRNGLLDAGEEAQASYLCHGEAGSDGQDGAQALLASTQIPAGEQCVVGGYRIDTGLDSNANGLLEGTEVTANFYVCNGVDGENGTDGLQSLINISSEPAGDNCAAGGKQIQVGVDLDGSATLESAEVQKSAFLCHGENGLDGVDGQDGAEGQPGNDGLDGADGEDGAPGSDGENALLSTQEEPAGTNCAAGGVALLVGLDQNGNNVLDSAEVQSTTYLCHGAGGPQAQSFILQYRAQAGGEIVGSTVQEVMLGDAGETVTAVPDSGYYFTTWSDGNTSASRTDSSVQSDINVLAGFDIYEYTLTYTAGSYGSLSGIVGQTVFHGSDGSAVEAVPETGYHFVSWSDGSTQNPRVDLAAQQNVSVSASFEINEYSLTYLAGAGGSVAGNSAQVVAHGGDGAVVAAVPDSGYRFIQWSDGVTTTNRTDTDVQSDLQVTAEFREQLSPPEEVNTGVNNGSLVLSWDSNPYADSYNVYYALEPGVTPENYDSLPGGGMLTGVSSPVTLEELDGGQRYYFVVTTVIDGTESASGDELSLLLPNTPWLVSAHQGRLRVDLTSATTAKVDWDIGLDETGSSFNLYISKDPNADLSQYASYGVDLRLNVTPPMSIENLEINEPVYIALEVDGRIADWTNTVSTTWGVNGTVNTQALGDDGTRYVGGNFTSAGQNVGGVAAFPAGNNAVNPHILALPQVNGAVHAVISDGRGGWYIGGDFTRAGDYARMRLAHIAPSGRVTDWNPGANDTVLALALHGDTIYAGGDFTSAGNGTAGIARNKLAAFDASGELLAWNPYANGPVKAIAVSDDAVFVGGEFTQIGGGSAAVERAYAAKIDFGGALLSWASVPGRVNALAIHDDNVFIGGRFTIGEEPERYIDSPNRRIDYRKNFVVFSAFSGRLVEGWPVISDGEVNAISVSSKGGAGAVYIGSEGRVGIQRYEFFSGDYYEYKPSFCEHAAAFSFDVNLNCFNKSSPVHAIVPMGDGVAVAESSGSIFGVDGDSISVMATDGNEVVVAGDFNVAGGGDRLRLAAFDDEGFLKDWNPGADAAVSALVVNSDVIYAGGSFTLSGDGIASTERNHLAAYDAAGNLLSWNPGVDKAVSALTVNHGVVYAGGGFSTVSDNSGTFARHCLAAFDSSGNLLPWNPEGNGWVYALAASDDRIYVGSQSTTNITSCGTGTDAYRNLAAFDLDGNLVTWPVETNGKVMAVAIDGSTVYAMGTFSEAGGGTGSATRNRLAAFDTNGNLTGWNPGLSEGRYSNSPSALMVSNGVIYAAGDFTGAGGGTGESAVNGMAAFAPSGLLAGWMPELDGRPASMVTDGNGIYVGGAFAHAAGGEAVARRSGLVIFDTNGNVLEQ